MRTVNYFFRQSLLVVLLCAAATLQAQIFTEVQVSLPVLSGSSDWGDYDNDGDTDLLLSGTVGSSEVGNIYLFRNNGDGTFTKHNNLGFLPVKGICNWLDFNNDARLDIFTSGERLINGYDQPATILYEQKPGPIFEIVQDDSLFDLTNPAFDYGDINNDGSIDIALMGYTSMYPNYHSLIYENNSGLLTESLKYKIEQLSLGSLDLGDYDNDGDLDLLQTGYIYDWNNSQYIIQTNIYRNDVDSLKKISTGIPGCFSGSASWGDFDADGDFDILMTGFANAYPNETGIFKIYLNNGNDNFTPIPTPVIPNFLLYKSVWGDIDNDGDFDVIVSGRSSDFEFNATYLYLNQNGTLVVNSQLNDFGAFSLNLTDYDNDGDLDLFCTGWAPYSDYIKLYRNDITTVNNAPLPPTNLTDQRQGNSVTFSWDSATDDHTDQKSLTYNIFVKTDADSLFIIKPYANTETGSMQKAGFGNTGHRTSYKLFLDDPTINYTWGVQTIDNAYKGSVFAVPGQVMPVVITDQPSGLLSNTIDLNARINPNGLSLEVWFEYGTDTTQLTNTGNIQLTGNSLTPITQELTNLQFNTLYYYRAAAGTIKGDFVAFTTEPDGIEENAPQMVLYPNPSNGLMHIDLPGASDGVILIYDQVGMLCMELNYSDIRKTGLLDISKLEKGVYYVVFANDRKALNKMVIRL